MSDIEIETLSTLFMVFICSWLVGSTVGWWIFLQLFKKFDNYMQDRYWAKRGFEKIKGEDGKEWYVGYGWPYDN
jgi:hypothetical protein